MSVPTCQSFVVHRAPLVAQSIHSLLCGEPTIVCGGWATTAAAALDRAGTSGGTWVIDVELPQSGAAILCDALQLGDHGTHVLLLAPLDTDDDVERAVAMLQRGVTGVVSTNADSGCLVEAVRAVTAGELWIPRRLEGRMVRSLRLSRTVDDDVIRRLLRLTGREREILALLCRGQSRSDVAEALQISAHTVRTHVQRIIQKFEVHSQGEVVSLGLHHKLPERFVFA